jgi:hypothetical protein
LEIGLIREHFTEIDEVVPESIRVSFVYFVDEALKRVHAVFV